MQNIFLTFTYFFLSFLLLDFIFLLFSSHSFMLKRLQKLLRVLATEHGSKKTFLEFLIEFHYIAVKMLKKNVGGKKSFWIIKSYLFSMENLPE